MDDAVILAFKPFATPSPRLWAVQKDEEEEQQSTAQRWTRRLSRVRSCRHRLRSGKLEGVRQAAG